MISSDTSLKILHLSYVASAVHAVLEPFKEGKLVELSERDRKLIEKARAFINSVLKGCELVNSPEHLFSGEEEVFSAPSSLDIALDVFLTAFPSFPETPDQIVLEFTSYKDILNMLLRAEAPREEEKQRVERMSCFFAKLAEKGDSESFQRAIGASPI